MADLNQFAFSFSHGTITLNDVIFTGIGSISGDQSIDRSAVYGTARGPSAMSQGQVGLGEGSVTFNDLKEGMEFYKTLADSAADASRAIFACEYTLENSAGETIRIDMIACSLSNFSFDFENGADALGIEFPFNFMRMKVDGREFAT